MTTNNPKYSEMVQQLVNNLWDSLPAANETRLQQAHTAIISDEIAKLYPEDIEKTLRILTSERGVAHISVVLDHKCQDNYSKHSGYYWKPFISTRTVYNYAYGGVVVESSRMIVVTVIAMPLLTQPLNTDSFGLFIADTED